VSTYRSMHSSQGSRRCMGHHQEEKESELSLGVEKKQAVQRKESWLRYGVLINCISRESGQHVGAYRLS
jgi:hypothetical protein